MAGNINSGRHKLPSTILKELNPIIDDAMPSVVAKLIEKALAGDKDCLIRIFNHKFGMPRTELDMRIKQTLSFSPDELALMSQVTVSEIPALALTAASEQIEGMDNEQTITEDN